MLTAHLAAPVLSRTSDDAMIANFWRREAESRRVVNLAEEDLAFTRIAPTFVHAVPVPGAPASAPRPELPAERWAEYRRLIEATGAQDGIVRYDTSVWFLYWAVGLATRGRTKGYFYSTTPVEPVVASLHDIPFPVESLKPVYRRITDNWYLFYEWDD